MSLRLGLRYYQHGQLSPGKRSNKPERCVQPKNLRKLIQNQFKKFAALTEVDCMFRFLELVQTLVPFSRETFKCALGTGWSVPVELVIGPSVGISYLIDRAGEKVSPPDYQTIDCGCLTCTAQPTPIAGFHQVETILTHRMDQDSKAILQLSIAGAEEVRYLLPD
ncbi:PTK2 [Cordylochernes scorpioides]|uniref:PTK2 n=1 Tax=Cordylochernes scorpioides TaxID=51811 RepID=A0ABY6K7D4_9ARAC|nr:PTK2 [Cordylochernes scorpioides]